MERKNLLASPDHHILTDEDAIDYAAEILEGFDEGQGPPPIAVLLDALADEYDTALQERRGMDPALVRIIVQRLIDAARFHPDNAPDIFDPDKPGGTALLDTPLFRYVRQSGRPENKDAVVRVAYTAGAVAVRFDIKLYRNNEPSRNKSVPSIRSACDVVAAANAKLGLVPSSYSGVRNCLGRNSIAEIHLEDGKLMGKADRKLANKLATTDGG